MILGFWEKYNSSLQVATVRRMSLTDEQVNEFNADGFQPLEREVYVFVGRSRKSDVTIHGGRLGNMSLAQVVMFKMLSKADKMTGVKKHSSIEYVLLLSDQCTKKKKSDEEKRTYIYLADIFNTQGDCEMSARPLFRLDSFKAKVNVVDIRNVYLQPVSAYADFCRILSKSTVNEFELLLRALVSLVKQWSKKPVWSGDADDEHAHKCVRNVQQGGEHIVLEADPERVATIVIALHGTIRLSCSHVGFDVDEGHVAITPMNFTGPVHIEFSTGSGGDGGVDTATVFIYTVKLDTRNQLVVQFDCDNADGGDDSKQETDEEETELVEEDTQTPIQPVSQNMLSQPPLQQHGGAKKRKISCG